LDPFQAAYLHGRVRRTNLSHDSLGFATVLHRADVPAPEAGRCRPRHDSSSIEPRFPAAPAPRMVKILVSQNSLGNLALFGILSGSGSRDEREGTGCRGRGCLRT
jgi:hypothetical protein